LRALQHEIDHLNGKLYIDYLESMDELLTVAQLHEETETEDELEFAPLA
jgi:peptide deformylase